MLSGEVMTARNDLFSLASFAPLMNELMIIVSAAILAVIKWLRPMSRGMARPQANREILGKTSVTVIFQG